MDRRLMEAVVSGDVDRLRQLLDQNNSLLLELTPGRNTALHVAVRYEHEHLLRDIYCRRRSLLMMENSKGDTPLHLAARAGNLKIVQHLVKFAKTFETLPMEEDIEIGGIDAGAILRKQTYQNDTALHEAVRKGHLNVVKELLRVDSKVPCLVNRLGECPLYLAAERGWLEIAFQLLRSPNSCDHGGPNGRTALHAAVVHGNFDITKKLVEKIPELLNKADAFGRTALHYSISAGDTRTVRLLLHSKPSTAYHLDEDGVSPLHIAAAEGNIEMIQELIQNCPDCGELTDKRNRNALHFAVETKSLRAVKHILDRPELKQMINEGDSNGNTPLHLATINFCYKIVRVLSKDDKVDLWAVNNDGFTAREIALSMWRESTDFYVRQYQALFLLLRAAKMFGCRGKVIQRSYAPTQEAQVARRESYQNYASTLIVVAMLIASVTFGAAYGLPGGVNGKEPGKGLATLMSKAALKAFLIFDTIAMCSSITLLFLLIRVKHASAVTVTTELYVDILLGIALFGMSIAFVTGVYVVVAAKHHWLAISICIMGCSLPFVSLY